MNHRLARIRRLRNRVFHHEPIYRLTAPPLLIRYGEIVDTLGWIDPAFLEMTNLVDRFLYVHEHGLAESERDILRFAHRPR